MKSFPANFTAAKNALSGSSPLWILKITAGGVDYYLSDTEETFPAWNGGVTTKPWISKWGALSEGLNSGRLDEIIQADMGIDLLVDPDASPNIVDLATTYELEESPAVLYLWFRNLDDETDPPQAIFSGFIDDLSQPDETSVSITLIDGTSRLEGYVGNKLTVADYPYADQDDIGKVIPIPFGTVGRVPSVCVLSGHVTYISSAISATATSFSVTDAGTFAVDSVLIIDSETVLVTEVDGDTLTVTRGYDGSIATSHSKAAAIWEALNTFDYIASDVPVDSIDKVVGVVGDAELDITEVATVYTGQTGDEHPDYPGKAVIVLPGFITVDQAVDLLVSDTISVDDAIEVTDSVSISDAISVYDTIAVSDDIDASDSGHEHTGSTIIVAINPDGLETSESNWVFGNPSNSHDGNLDNYDAVKANVSNVATFSFVKPLGYTGTPVRFRWCATHGHATYNHGFYLDGRTVSGSSTKITTKISSWTSVSSWSQIQSETMSIQGYPLTTGYIALWDVWIEVEYSTDTSEATADVTVTGSVTKTGTVTKDGTVTKSGAVIKTGSVTKLGTVTISGNSTANTLIGDEVLAYVTRSATISEQFDELLAPAGFSDLLIVGTMPDGYALNGVITEYERTIDWLSAWAFQLRSWFRLTPDGPRLFVRPDSLTVTKQITAIRLKDDGRRVLQRSKVARSMIVNAINLLYDRDWTDSGDSAYRGAVTSSDAASIATYGEREEPSLFKFDFVTSATMAASLLAFYLAYYAVRHWQYQFEVYLDHAELEFADVVQLDFLASQTGQITEASFAPGNHDTCDTIALTVIA